MVVRVCVCVCVCWGMCANTPVLTVDEKASLRLAVVLFMRAHPIQHTHIIPIHLCTHICAIAKSSDAIVRTKARARVHGENESNSEGEDDEGLWVEV